MIMRIEEEKGWMYIDMVIENERHFTHFSLSIKTTYSFDIASECGLLIL
jgi:hypothetical protein